jgi:hypothetical protein
MDSGVDQEVTMVGDAKLEPGWLARDVENAAARVKSLETKATSREQAPQPVVTPQPQKKQLPQSLRRVDGAR